MDGLIIKVGRSWLCRVFDTVTGEDFILRRRFPAHKDAVALLDILDELEDLFGSVTAIQRGQDEYDLTIACPAI